VAVTTTLLVAGCHGEPEGATKRAVPTAKQMPSLDVAVVLRQRSSNASGDWRAADAELAFWLNAEAFNESQRKARLQMLESWAEHPRLSLDALTYALVDPDESVRAQAEQLLEVELTRQ
jgi:hypothetical protein